MPTKGSILLLQEHDPGGHEALSCYTPNSDSLACLFLAHLSDLTEGTDSPETMIRRKRCIPRANGDYYLET